MYGGQTTQFTAMVANGCTSGVTWSIDPTTGAGTISAAGLYTAPAAVSAQQNVTITATSQSDGSKVGTATVTLLPPIAPVAPPAFNPPAGTYTAAQTVTISSTTAGASIRYTTDGTQPTSAVGTLYTAPIAVSANTTLNAIAYKTGMADSTAAPATYIISLPVVSAVSPTSGTQGQSVPNVAITGVFTHFTAGSLVTFGNPGVTASGITLTDATHLTATLTIAAGAATGASSVTVTTGSEVATGNGLFTVTAGTPAVQSLSTTSGAQGQSVPNVTITGVFTHFTAGSLVTFGNPGVTASGITLTDATHLTATLTIAAGAATGASSVTVTTGSEVATGSGLFTVTAGTPAVQSLSTTSGQQGQSVPGVTITGVFTHFTAGSVVTFGNPGVTASSITLTDATHLTATLTIAAGAATGASSVTVTTGSEVATGSGLFTVTAGTPAVQSLSTTSGQQGQSVPGVTITGMFTHFTAGSVVTFGNPGVTASSITLTDATHLTATLTIAAGAATGASSVTVTTGSEVATGNGLFTVTAGTPAVQSLSTASGQQGQFVPNVTITGMFTHFTAGSLVTFGNPGVTASSIALTDATHLAATLTIAAGAATGASSVTVTTGSEVATGNGLFTVTAGTPAVQSLSTASGQQGQSVPNVTITGMFTRFTAGSLVTFGNPGVTASSITLTDATHLTATLTIAAGASTGASSVTVTTGSEVATGSGLFTVTAGTPAVQSLSTASGQQGQSVPGVTITGMFTHFTAGSVVTFGNPGVTASGITPIDATHLTATLTIAAGAATGASSVTVTTGSEVATGNGLFTVTAGTPSVQFLSTTSGAQGQSVPNVTITGVFTHFTAGSLVTFGNPGVTASGITASDTTRILTATLTIAAGGGHGRLQCDGDDRQRGGHGERIVHGDGGHSGSPIAQHRQRTAGSVGAEGGRTITGVFTHFTAGSLVTFGNPGVTASGITLTDATHLTATLTIAAGAATGASNVTVTTGSEVATGSNLFTVTAGTPVAAPTFTPTAGTYTSAQTVAINTATSGASIRYTTDGSTPSETVGTLYGAPVMVNATTTINAIAFKTGMTDSTMATATYTLLISVTISPTWVTLSGGQTQQFTATVTNASDPGVTWSLSLSGYGTISATGLYTGPASVTASQNITVTATSVADPTKSAIATISLSTCTLSPYSHVRAIVIDHTKVPNTDQANFPVLISGTYSYLATSANGGAVQNANGYDIIFTSDYSGANKLDHEMESYNSGTGAIVAWVRIPNLSHTADTVIYLNYGNKLVTASQENNTGVWDSTYGGIYHLANGTTLSVRDSSGKANNGSLQGSPAAIAGQIDGGANFANSSDDIAINSIALSGVNYTVSAWFNWPLPANGSWNTLTRGASADHQVIVLESNWHLGAYDSATGTGFNDSGFAMNTLSNGWHYLTAVGSGSGTTYYIDGAKVGAITFRSNSQVSYLGNYQGGGQQWGKTDEIRVSTTARSADWIASEYNNQSSPATFYSVYAEGQTGVVVSPGAATLYGSQQQQFNATPVGVCSDTFTWRADTAGTISASGLYSAPAAVSTQQIVTITATSQLDSTKSASSTVTLMPPISVAMSPLTATLSAGQTLQFAATLQNTSNQAVTWALNPPGTGTITGTGLYSPPSAIFPQQIVTVTATSVMDPTKSASATVTLSDQFLPNASRQRGRADLHGSRRTDLDSRQGVHR